MNEEYQNWALSEARSLFDFFLPASINPNGGFYNLDAKGKPLTGDANAGQARELHATTRMVHCAAIGKLLGYESAQDTISHGMDFIWSHHRDKKHGGYFWSVGDEGPIDPIKQAYGHGFVLLAASSAKVAGHADADRLITDITDVLLKRFWDGSVGATTEEYNANWTAISDYRGQNSNMHLTEALMAAFEATGQKQYLSMANQIAELIINNHARTQAWRVPEHFNQDWQIDHVYAGDPMFRPAGVTPGHALEWARLIVQLWHLNGSQDDWMIDAAKNLFLTACHTAWNADKGGFYYTVDWQDKPDQTNRFWWPCCEGLAAAAALYRVSESAEFSDWFGKIWRFIDTNIIDRQNGGWHPELDNDLKPTTAIFNGKPDIYHALQACLIPLLPADGSITFQLNKQEVAAPLRSAFK